MLDNTQSIICAFGLAAAAPRSPYRYLELCGIALIQKGQNQRSVYCITPPQPIQERKPPGLDKYPAKMFFYPLLFQNLTIQGNCNRLRAIVQKRQKPGRNFV